MAKKGQKLAKIGQKVVKMAQKAALFRFQGGIWTKLTLINIKKHDNRKEK